MASRALILCAGLGTRLRPLTEELPKPLVPVGDRPLIAHIAAILADAGVTDVAVNVHHLPGHFDRELQRIGLPFHVVHEPEIRGTAGGIAGAREHLGLEPLLVWNGDILTRPPVADLLSAAASGDLCLAVRPSPPGEGTVGLDEEGRLVRIRGRTFGTEARGGDYVGVAAVGTSALAKMPERGCLVGDFVLPTLERGGRVLAVTTDEPFRDVGSVAGYLAANREWLERRGTPAGWTHPSARLDGAVTVVGSVVGEGASVAGAGALTRAVVWPFAAAQAPLADAVVMRDGRVVGAFA